MREDEGGQMTCEIGRLARRAGKSLVCRQGQFQTRWRADDTEFPAKERKIELHLTKSYKQRSALSENLDLSPCAKRIEFGFSISSIDPN